MFYKDLLKNNKNNYSFLQYNLNCNKSTTLRPNSSMRPTSTRDRPQNEH